MSGWQALRPPTASAARWPLLLLMSIGAWVVILWKAWVLRRAGPRHRARGAGLLGRRRRWTTAAPGSSRWTASACCCRCSTPPLRVPAAGTLEGAGAREAQLTRRLRDALHRGLAHLQFGQVLLASVGSTAPFVGLFGTVWGVYHALAGIADAGQLGIDKVAGPVGEALIMTAAGIAVAVPAVLAYNLFGKWVAASEAELEGFAHDLRQTAAGRAGGARLMAFGRLERAPRLAPDERDQHDAADRRDAGAAGDLHHHRAADRAAA